MSEATGPKPTKYCKRCDRDLPRSEFSRSPARHDGLHSRCRDCQQQWNDERAIAQKLAGGQEALRLLDPDEREVFVRRARELYEAGQTIGGAEDYMERRKDGFVYVIAHPRLSGIKIGRACNPRARLRNYQTGCPRRQYVLRYAEYFEDAHLAEAQVHLRLSSYRLEGEWFAVNAHEAQEAIKGIKRRHRDNEIVR